MALAQAVARFLDSVGKRLGELVGQGISWNAAPGDRDVDLQWWSCGLTVDAACRLYAGASSETWEALRRSGDGGFAVLVEAIEKAAAERFGARVKCTDIESCDAPREGTPSAIETPAGAIELSMSAELVEALGGEAEREEADTSANPSANHSMDMLLHVEIPVSVSLGRTRMKMKELLGLSHGSVVELDQELGEQVEIRVNNCVIAHGEVVAVDGNYGVRILSMVSNRVLGRGAV